MDSKALTYLCVVLAVIALLLMSFVCKCKDQDQENFRKCICANGGYTKRDCQDTETVQQEYDSGELTEFTELPKRGWTKTSPGDVNWPTSVGCTWPDVENSGKWAKWDFTDFGS